jgi:3'(2'), 5'-bisphosphate nucleotidase
MRRGRVIRSIKNTVTSDLDLTREVEYARKAALAAGEILMRYYGTEYEIGSKGKNNPVTIADTEADAAIKAILMHAFPDYGWLSEETVDSEERLTKDRVWIVDPLDGTREFSELGRDDWAVHVALWQAGELIAGAVALPAQGMTLATPEVAYPAAFDGPPRVVVSRTRPPAVALQVREALDGTLVEMGSAGAKVAAVIQGRADVYVHAGGQYEWDSAAPVAVARAAGLFTSRIDGSPLIYNQADPKLPDLIVCRPELAEAVLAVTR